MKNNLHLLIKGKVVKGLGEGKKIGFPTINIQTDVLNLDFGVYATRVYTSYGVFKGAAHFGPRKILNVSKPEFEVHLLDFSENLYDQEVSVEIIEKLRGTLDFKNFDEMIHHIAQDVQKVRTLDISLNP